MVVIDQLSSAELEVLAGQGLSDFGGLSARGAARYDAWYDNLATETGPGHATISTGVSPPTHGICGNEWYADGGLVYCVEDPSAPVLGAKGIGRGPANLEAPTLGDTLKAWSPGSKVVSISVKDRAAVLMGGRSADVVLWFEPSVGRFTSSRAWTEALPSWAEEPSQLPKKSDSATWSIDAAGPAASFQDRRAGEGSPEGLGEVFPHNLSALPEARRPAAYRFTPNSVEDTVTLGLAALDAERLGARGVKDLLWLSLSAPDYAGHAWGPLSSEKVDMLWRVSEQLKRLTLALDRKLGKNGWVMVVTSDHGVAPLVEAAQKAGASRVSVETLLAGARTFLDGAASKRVLGVSAPHVYLDERGLDDVARDKLRSDVRRGLAQVAGLREVHVRGHETNSLSARSGFRDRCGAVVFELGAFQVFAGKGYTNGTDHASGNAYDRRVPLFLVGSAVKPGFDPSTAAPRDAAPSLAQLLGIPPPELAEGRPLPAAVR